VGRVDVGRVKGAAAHAPADQAKTFPDVPPILSNVPGSFAWEVSRQRHPVLVKQIRDAFPYPPNQVLDWLGQHRQQT
jgi:hypothetical protein